MTAIDLALRRRFFAEDIEATCAVKTPGLIDALACVHREAFLQPGPWLVAGEALAITGGPHQTPDADPRHVYHNLSIAIDPARMLFNGAPGYVCVCIDALGLRTGARVLHVGAGLGYYTALMGHCVGPTGRVLAFEVDERLADRARANLVSFPWVELRHGDASAAFGEKFDAILSSAGLTHPPDAWLDALVPGGCMVAPLTVALAPGSPLPLGARGATIGKGIVVAITRSGDDAPWPARAVSPVAIYSAIGLRDETMNARLGEALQKSGPMLSAPLKHLRRDAHDRGASCWLHGATWCLSTE